MIYLVVIMAILAGCFIYDYRGATKGKLIYWIILMLVLICISGFRYKMGTDSIKYENYYHWQHTLSELRADDFKDTRFAPLYIIVSTICRSITYDFMLMQFVVSITVNCSVFYFLWKNARNIFFASFLYVIALYINLNMEVLREGMAVSVFLWAWPYFRDGKWLKYYLLCVIAFLFHLSAIIMFFLPLLWVPGVRWFFTFGPRTWIICSAVLLGSFILQLFFFDFIKAVAFTENMIERADVYSKTDLGGNTLNIAGILTQLIKTAIYPVVALWFLHKNPIKEKNCFEKQTLMTLLAIYFALLSIGVTIFIRYRNYFYIFSILTMSDWLFSVIKYKGKYYRLKLVYWIMLFLPLIGLQIFYYFGNYNKSGSLKIYNMYYPYSNRFDEKIDPDRQKAISYSRKL